MKCDFVSIIIPVFNSEKHLEKTIISALNQTWPTKEIIIVDDGSTDASLSIANKYKSNNVTVIQQENKGASIARNTGLKEAKGDYIQFLDADDLLSPDKIESQIKLLMQNSGKIAVCSTVHFFDDEDHGACSPSPYEDSFLYDSENPAEFLSNLYGGRDNRGSMIQTNAWLTPVEVIKKAGNWSEFYSPDDDGEFFCRVVLVSKGIVYCKDCFNYYRKYKSGNNFASANTKKALHGKFQSFLLKKQYLLNATNDPIAKRALARCAMDLAINAFPADKKLTSEILRVVKDLGGTDYIPKMGGEYLEFIKRVFGWKTAKILQTYYNALSANRIKIRLAR